MRFPKLLASLSGVFVAGCLVSFNDYPKGDLRPEAGSSSGASGGSGGSSGGGAAGGTSKGGSVSAAGSAGTGGSLELMIDDFEDGNVTLLPVSSRVGSWYMGNDGGGFQMPFQNTGLVDVLEPLRGSSERGLHTSGRGFDEWGAMVRADFKVVTGVAQLYDISAYTGVTLWVRSGDERNYEAKVQIATPDSSEGCSVCGDHFGTVFETTPEWQQVFAPFASMVQEGYGVPPLSEFTLDQALGIQVSFPKGEDFDVWVDDVSFY